MRRQWLKSYNLETGSYYWMAARGITVSKRRPDWLLGNTDLPIVPGRWERRSTKLGVPWWFDPATHAMRWNEPQAEAEAPADATYHSVATEVQSSLRLAKHGADGTVTSSVCADAGLRVISIPAGSRGTQEESEWSWDGAPQYWRQTVRQLSDAAPHSTAEKAESVADGAEKDSWRNHVGPRFVYQL